MLKKLAMFVALIFISIPSVTCQPDHASDGKESGTAQRQPAPIATDTPNENHASNTDQAKANNHTPKWYEALKRPDWWVLVVATLTGLFVGWQSWETRKAAQASLKQARLLRRQIKIQEAGMRQWVDVESRDAGVATHYRSGKSSVYVVELRFEAINNTSFVLTIQKIRTSVGMEADAWEIFTVETNVDLSPKRESGSNVYSFYVPAETIKREWFEKGTVVTLNGEVRFLDCLGNARTAYFGGLYQCSAAGFYKIEPMGITPDRKKVYARNPSEPH